MKVLKMLYLIKVKKNLATGKKYVCILNIVEQKLEAKWKAYKEIIFNKNETVKNVYI